jgi:hypothetical protein
MRSFLERVLFASPLEQVLALQDETALANWHGQTRLRGDLRLFLTPWPRTWDLDALGTWTRS